jgi:hypothetical protein
MEQTDDMKPWIESLDGSAELEEEVEVDVWNRKED